jgi:group I intron endonuclease
MRTAVYKITNSVNGKLYFGLSAHPASRWSTHKRRAIDGYVSKLSMAMRKHGVAAFSFEVIHWCDSREDANELEHFFIEEAGTRLSGYNIREGGDSGSHSEESKIKIGLIGLGREVTSETREKISVGLTGYKRPPMSDETKQKLSKACSGFKHTPEAVEKIRQTSTGRKYPNRKPHSPETYAKAAKAISATRTKNAKKVLCVETGEVFESARLAARACGVSEALVSIHCRGKMNGGKSMKGFTFRYAE